MTRKLAIALGLLALIAAGWALLDRDPVKSLAPPSLDSPLAERLRVGISALPPQPGNPFSSFGVPSIYAWAALFEPLTHVTEAGEVQPMLAIAWREIEPLRWRFEIRPGARFHRGTFVTPADIAWNFNFIVGPEARGFSIPREVDFVAGAEVSGPGSVDILLKTPNPLLPRYLALMPIVEPAEWIKLGAAGFSANPSGTGPYRLVRWTDNGAELEAFADAWRKAPSRRLDLVVIPDAAARLQAWQAGQVDLAVLLSPDQNDSVQAMAGRMNVGRPASVIATHLY